MLYCVDVETTGANWTKDHVFGAAVATPDCSIEDLIADPKNAPLNSEYFDVRRQPQRYQQLLDSLNGGTLANHNAKFDAHFLMNDGANIDLGQIDCTMIRAALIDEHLKKYSLDALGEKYLGIRKENEIYRELADLFDGPATRKAQMQNLQRAPVETVEPYARKDAELALRLWAWQEAEIRRQGLEQVWALEKRLFPHVVRMERNGIRVDIDEAEQRAQELTQRINHTQKELNRIAGFEVNPNPSKSITNLFQPYRDEDENCWRAVDGTKLDETPAGNPSINADALRRMEHPAASMILRLRKMLKTRDTFIRGHIIGHAVQGRVHPNINQVKGDETGGTSTGRLSYTDPALQQIPSRDEEIAKIVRPIFLPDEGQGWAYGDLEQHELRIFYHYAKPPEILERYRQDPDTDGHQVVSELTGLPRSPGADGGANAKQVNLSLVFNMGGGMLAQKMNLPYTEESFTDKRGNVHEYKKAGPEAQQVMETYHEMVPGVREVAQKASTVAKSRGYVVTIMGRHIRFPGGEFVYKASGLIYQGSSADMIKLDICNICEYLQENCPEGRLLLSIHDEYSLSLPKDGREKEHLDNVRDLIQRRPGLPVELRVPIRIDFAKPADNWWAATEEDKIHDD